MGDGKSTGKLISKTCSSKCAAGVIIKGDITEVMHDCTGKVDEEVKDFSCEKPFTVDGEKVTPCCCETDKCNDEKFGKDCVAKVSSSTIQRLSFMAALPMLLGAATKLFV